MLCSQDLINEYKKKFNIQIENDNLCMFDVRSCYFDENYKTEIFDIISNKKKEYFIID